MPNRPAPPWSPARLPRCVVVAAVLGMSVACRSGTKGPADPADPDDPGADDGGSQTDVDPEEVPSANVPWLRREIATPGSITFNELQYHPASTDDTEWIELHNPMALDMDLSGWSLEGGVSYTFDEGTVIAAGGYLVVAADPSGLKGALGPFDGVLSDSGERVDLVNNSDRLIDTIGYDTDDPWPVHADGSGVTLAKVDPDAASDHAENWTGSAELGGTPGATNLLDPDGVTTTVSLVELAATWTYELSGDEPDPNWADTDFDDSGWDSGTAVFYAGAAQDNAIGTAWVTADNFYGIYLGRADGSDLRLVGEDPDGDWTTVEGFDLEVTPEDHLYVAAWEAPSDYGGPQMVIAEVELPDAVVGTDASGFEWVLGPTGDCPGSAPADPPPTAEALLLVVEDSNTMESWDVPAVDADRSSDPWGWANSASFSADTRYVWVDTFGDTSVTNTENTYALFRSVEPLLGSRGTTELLTIPTTVTFRTRFDLDADPATAELLLDCELDDGAVFYINGSEVHRENMPTGTVSAETLASAAVSDAASLTTVLAGDALVRGDNVLAVEVHQAENPDLDLTFGCALSARITPDSASPTVLFNEVGPAEDDAAWVELIAVSDTTQQIGGLVLVSSAGGEQVLEEGEIAPGALLAIDDLEFATEAGDVLFLYSADRTDLLDAVRVHSGLRGRADEGGPWRVPTEASPGAPNTIELVEDVVISEVQYHKAPLSRAGEPYAEQAEEWIELTNRGTTAVDLSGWQLVDGVTYTFPDGTELEPGAFLVVAGDAAALKAEHSDITVLGDFKGRLDNSSDRILLLDAIGNPADEVRYFDGGRWPEASDGGGSSLELRDVWADNSTAEAWAASDEVTRSGWATYSYRGTAESSAVGPDGAWEELVVGLLDRGEVLIDDLSVVRDPDGSRIEQVSNGGFDGDSDAWRLLGNHRWSEVVPDPDDGGNSVLRLVATGPTGHMHNHAESTLLQATSNQEHEVSFRARWVSGSNQLNTRLYFNRLPFTTLVEQPTESGTPGAPNSTAVDNLGPTMTDLQPDVAVPAAGEPVSIRIEVDDPDGVAAVTLWSAVDGAAFEGVAMTETDAGVWQGTLGGEAAGSIVQLYVEAEDERGATATFPAAGADSRALLRWDDSEAATNGLHNLRILMTEADSDWMHDDVNLMSDDLVGATVVYNESQVYFDVGVRPKGSQRGRPEQPRLGYGLRFHREQPFRGSHTSALVDRSEGVGYGQREVLMNLVMTRAGSVSGEYNDLVQALTPLSEHTGPAELQLDRFTNLVLDSQFDDGASGPLYEYELIYYPTTTDDGTAEGLKLPAPDDVIGTSITDLGDDKEAYRWNFLLQNNERADNYDPIIALGQTFALSGDSFLSAADAVIDVDQWLRAFAFATLSGAVDNYGSDGSQHNAQLYVRPDDQRVLYFPHDLDFFGGSTMAVVGNGDLSRLLQDPANLRSYYGHLQDIIGRAYSSAYLGPWCEQLGLLLEGQDFAGHCEFVDDRADWVMNGASDSVMAVFPAEEFQITTGGGADFSVKKPEVTLTGVAWLDVRAVALDGEVSPLGLTWLDEDTWQVTVPLVDGPNMLELVALDLRGAVVGGDSIEVTLEGAR
jgi:Lamin Tail Domain